MDYFVWKDKDSRTIQGLIVTELPAITKPRMRTQTSTIDGMDGSQIVDLGYETYTKAVKIGLTRNYSLDTIIAWLNGESTVRFSNEPDKYYKAKIIDQIDYDKLFRFKTATIKFTVQPFKYSSIERTKTLVVSGQSEINVTNAGNYTAKPIISFYGSGIVNISLNGITKCTLDLSNDDFITLDCDALEAYAGDTLKNRQMDGEFLVLETGKNTISWTGNLTKIEISNYSRWL